MYVSKHIYAHICNFMKAAHAYDFLKITELHEILTKGIFVLQKYS